MKKKSVRIAGLDIIRSLAIFCVIAVHFFYSTGFYNSTMIGKKMVISLFIRELLYICVPLFLILTGYLNNKRKIDSKYYKKIIPVLTSYYFIATISVIFKKYYLHHSLPLSKMIIQVLNFTANDYSWYVEMYIGLFLLIPFLNVLYEGIKTKKHKQHLIMTFIVLISLPPLVNPLYINGYQMDIIPDWWASIYPLLYYFIGCYIKEYQPKFDWKKNILYIILLLLIQTNLVYLYNYGNKFDYSFINGYGNLFTVLVATLVFIILYQIDFKNKIVNSAISRISKYSFDMYLLSFLVDSIIYNIYDFKYRIYLKYAIIIVPIIFITTFVLAFIKEQIFKLCSFIYNKIKIYRAQKTN